MTATEAGKIRWTDSDEATLLLEVGKAKTQERSLSSAYKVVSELLNKKVPAIAQKHYELRRIEKSGQIGLSKVQRKVSKKQKKEGKSNLSYSQRLIQQLLSGGIEIGATTSITITPTELTVKF